MVLTLAIDTRIFISKLQIILKSYGTIIGIIYIQFVVSSYTLRLAS